MKERDTFIRAIGEGWDDTTPVLVFADWAEEHGTDNPALLRWYAWHVMPALAALPARCPKASSTQCDNAWKHILPHPQAETLLRIAAVAFVRHRSVWNSPHAVYYQPSVRVARLFALGLASDDERRRAHRRAADAEQAAVRDFGAQSDPNNPALNTELVTRVWGTSIATGLLGERGSQVARDAERCQGHARTPGMTNYQRAVYAALAAVPPLRIDEVSPRPVVQEVVREERPLPPMKLPRDKFRRIVVRGQAYGWRMVSDRYGYGGGTGRAFHIDEILVRRADNTGPRLRVRFGYYVWRVVGGRPLYPTPALAARIIEDALDAGWNPIGSEDTDYAVDGRAYLPTTDESAFG